MSLSPEIFVGSASEHSAVLSRLGALQTGKGARFLPWTETSVFAASEYTVPSLCRVFDRVDGAAFLSMSVDKTWWRGETVQSPRDNVVFEAGLAIGYLGLERTAIITDAEAKLPSDLKGLTTIPFNATGNLDTDVSILHARLSDFFCRVSVPKRVLRQMWDQNRYAVYFHSFDNPEQGELEEIVNFNAVRAIGHLTETFGRMGIGYSCHSSRLEELHVEENLVLLGSSASNALTRRLQATGSDQWPYRCVFDAANMGGRAVLDQRSAQLFPTAIEGDRISKDYGVLTKVQNPFSPDHWIVIAAGNYGYGTLGALRCALNAKDLTAASFAPDAAFQFLVEVPVTGRFSCGTPRIIGSAEL